jgi:hypothetical protein
VALWDTGYLEEMLGVRLRVDHTRDGDNHPEGGMAQIVVSAYAII